MRLILALSVVLSGTTLTTAANAEMYFVPDPAKHCGMEAMARNEETTTLYLNEDNVAFEEIEYYCEFQGKLDPNGWTSDSMTTLVGYCNEPGFFTPEMRLFMISQYDKNIITVYDKDGAGTVFHMCGGAQRD